MNESTANPALIDPSMKEIVESFLVETKEILEKLDVDLLELEKRPEDSALLNQVFRSFHTIKGTSGFLGLEKLPHITHACEDILNKLRKKEVVLNSELMEGITLGYDTIKVLIQVIETQQNEDVDTNEVDGVLQRLVLSIQSGIDANADRKIEKNEKKEEGNNSAVIEREDSVKDKTVLVHTADEVKARAYNLDFKNPHVIADDHGDPEELLKALDQSEQETDKLRDQLKAILSEALLR